MIRLGHRTWLLDGVPGGHGAIDIGSDVDSGGRWRRSTRTAGVLGAVLSVISSSLHGCTLKLTSGGASSASALSIPDMSSAQFRVTWFCEAPSFCEY
jgi:hypothetical protein